MFYPDGRRWNIPHLPVYSCPYHPRVEVWYVDERGNILHEKHCKICSKEYLRWAIESWEVQERRLDAANGHVSSAISDNVWMTAYNLERGYLFQ